MKPVTLTTSFNLAEAQMICSRLEAAGFHPFLANELTAGWLGVTSSASMLRIEVPESELADAKEFLAAPAE
jgi:hypothetical protein